MAKRLAENGHLTNGERQEAQDVFIKMLTDTANVRKACEKAGISRDTAYKWRAKYKTFHGRWDDAIQDAYDILEWEGWQRAKKKSDTLLLAFLKAHRRELYGDKQEINQKISGKLETKTEVQHHIDSETAKEIAKFIEQISGGLAGRIPAETE